MTRRSTTTIVQPLGGDAARQGAGLRQPDAWDESSTDAADGEVLAPQQHDVMAQAARDVASGQQDTDCRANPKDAGSACPPGPDARRGSGPSADPGATAAPAARDTVNRKGARHDPGRPAPAPDGSPRK